MSDWFEEENPDAPGKPKRIRGKPVENEIGIHDPNPPSRLIDPVGKDRIDENDGYRRWLDNEKRLNDSHGSFFDDLRDREASEDEEPASSESSEDRD